jgi:formylglycine-generating enzyme required for sulfatase activity
MEGSTKYRLPTGAEWEYACRAGTETPFSFGRCLSTYQANYNGNYPLNGCSKGQYQGRPAAVGSFGANAWGLHDMHGNVWEWCQDCYGDSPKGAATDPVGPPSGAIRVYRGGSLFSGARYCRSANRNRVSPGSRYSFLGFRLAKTS